jgi:hypothetical protein
MPPRTAVAKRGGKRRYVREVNGVPTEHINVTGSTRYWGVMSWAIPYGAKTVATKYLTGQESGILPALYEADPQSAFEWLKKAPYEDRDAAGAKGTKVHKLFEEWLKGDRDAESIAADVTDEGIADMYWGLHELCRRYEIVWERSEQTVFNSDVGYAGTMDGIVLIKFPGEDEPRRCVADIKTSRSVNKTEYQLQLAALRHGDVICHDDGSEEPMPETDELGVILWVRPDQEPQVIPVVADDQAFQHFKVCVAMAYAEQAADERVSFYPPLADPNDDTKLLTEREGSTNE